MCSDFSRNAHLAPPNPHTQTHSLILLRAQTFCQEASVAAGSRNQPYKPMRHGHLGSQLAPGKGTTCQA